MMLPKQSPVLRGDFGLIPVAERMMWRDALARHVLNELMSPEWKTQEQIEPVNLTIACLVERGMTDPAEISNHIIHMGSVRNEDAPSQ